MQGVQVQSLSGELRSHTPLNMVKKTHPAAPFSFFLSKDTFPLWDKTHIWSFDFCPVFAIVPKPGMKSVFPLRNYN